MADLNARILETALDFLKSPGSGFVVLTDDEAAEVGRVLERAGEVFQQLGRVRQMWSLKTAPPVADAATLSTPARSETFGGSLGRVQKQRRQQQQQVSESRGIVPAQMRQRAFPPQDDDDDDDDGDDDVVEGDDADVERGRDAEDEVRLSASPIVSLKRLSPQLLPPPKPPGRRSGGPRSRSASSNSSASLITAASPAAAKSTDRKKKMAAVEISTPAYASEAKRSKKEGYVTTLAGDSNTTVFVWYAPPVKKQPSGSYYMETGSGTVLRFKQDSVIPASAVSSRSSSSGSSSGGGGGRGGGGRGGPRTPQQSVSATRCKADVCEGETSPMPHLLEKLKAAPANASGSSWYNVLMSPFLLDVPADVLCPTTVYAGVLCIELRPMQYPHGLSYEYTFNTRKRLVARSRDEYHAYKPNAWVRAHTYAWAEFGIFLTPGAAKDFYQSPRNFHRCPPKVHECPLEYKVGRYRHLLMPATALDLELADALDDRKVPIALDVRKGKSGSKVAVVVGGGEEEGKAAIDDQYSEVGTGNSKKRAKTSEELELIAKLEAFVDAVASICVGAEFLKEEGGETYTCRNCDAAFAGDATPYPKSRYAHLLWDHQFEAMPNY